MAGKSNKGRNRRGSNNTTNSLEPVASSNAPVKDDITASEAGVATLNEVSAGSESTNGSSEIKESETANPASEAKQGYFYDIFFCFPKPHSVSLTAWFGNITISLPTQPSETVAPIIC